MDQRLLGRRPSVMRPPGAARPGSLFRFFRSFELSLPMAIQWQAQTPPSGGATILRLPKSLALGIKTADENKGAK